MPEGSGDNEDIAAQLEEVADLLEEKEANPFRVRSYARAAQTVRASGRAVREIYGEEGRKGLTALEGIGEGIAGAIAEILDTGEIGMLETLRAEADPVARLEKVPGVGEELAKRIRGDLGVETLEDLEVAAHDGRLSSVEGMGEKRVQGIRDALAGMLGRAPKRRSRERVEGREDEPAPPPVDLILELDEEYREKAEKGELRTLAPRRFNPEGEAWLPILETRRQGWKFTVLFSNTARAHERGKTRDWVVLYYERDGHQGQNTVVTATGGDLEGTRVVRGREAEMRRTYERNES